MKYFSRFKNLSKKNKIMILILVVIIVVAAAFGIYKIISSKSDADKQVAESGKTIEELKAEHKPAEELTPTAQVLEDNKARIAAVNFYGDYASKANNATNLNNYLQARGTANLLKQYNSKVKPGFNPLICGAKGNPTSSSITGATSVNGKKVYALRIMDHSKQLTGLQVTVVSQNNNYLIDNVACLGPV